MKRGNIRPAIAVGAVAGAITWTLFYIDPGLGSLATLASGWIVVNILRA